MTSINAFASNSNLELAWKRIRTGRNVAYKNFFREIYDAYNISAKDNIKRLSQNIKNGTYQPGNIERVFIPKPSGLVRPITLLNVEDQIVLQGIANVYAKKLFNRRIVVESKGVCSNRLNRNQKSKFFLKDWRINYNLFQRRKMGAYKAGNHYVAEFDLASFYDTVSHDLLISIYSKRGGYKDFCEKIKSYFKKWTPKEISHYSHSIPQGTIASNFLAECLLLSIDEVMIKGKDFHYIRYVDDILIFGKTFLDTHQGVALLEEKCRSIGLVPHSGKYGVKRLNNVEEALKLSASLGYETPGNLGYFNPTKSEGLFLECLSPRRDYIADIRHARYLLYRASPSEKVLAHCLRLLPKHPELIDVFVFYLEKFGERRKITNRVEKLLEEGIPYRYVEGRYWELLSTCANQSQADKFSKYALKRLQKVPKDAFELRLGIYKFLSVCEDDKATKKLFNCLYKEDCSLLQAMSLSQLSFNFPKKYLHRIFKICLKRKEPEPSLLVAYIMSYLGITPKELDIQTKQISPHAQDTLKNLGIIRRRFGAKPEPIGEILERHYNIRKEVNWKKLLNKDYKHANSLLIMSENSFETDPTAWMGAMDSFNDHVIRHLVEVLHSKGHCIDLPQVVSNNKLTNYGFFLIPSGYLSRNIPVMTRKFRSFHNRRNRLPYSHAKDKITQEPTIPLKHSDRSKYVKKLEDGYKDLINFILNM